MRRALTGIKPTGQPHVGNWLGMIHPAMALTADPDVEAFYFIADGHALTTVRDPELVRQHTLEVAATWLALGLDRTRGHLYRQSDVPEVFELAWMLSCHTPKGFLNRAHAYKAARDANVAAGADEDAGVNMGLFTYPVLMAADILIVDADLVPVGQDQIQHVEIARDIAQRINHQYGADVLRLPQAHVREGSAVVPGLDGRKMAKSHGNTLPCFLGPKAMRKAVMRIPTDSTPPEAPKDPDASLVFQIHRALLDPPEVAALAARYRAGISWGEAKQALADDLEARLAEPRSRFEDLVHDPRTVEDILQAGATCVRRTSGQVLDRVRAAMGIRPL